VNNLGGVCYAWKEVAVNSVFQLCDIEGNENAAQCIVDRLKDMLNE